MKMGHDFHPEHGFSGSAKPETNMRPKIPGFTHGGMPKVEHGKHAEKHDDHHKNESHGKEDKHGYHIHKMKKGGSVSKDEFPGEDD